MIGRAGRPPPLALHVEQRGDGPPLLLAMGWRANLAWWPSRLLAALERHHRLILIDNRGAGRTGDPGGAFSIAQMADDAAAVLDALGLARAHVLGVSMGGMIAQELALRRPDRVDRLILVCTHCGRRGVRASPAMRAAWRRWLRAPWRLDAHLAYLLFSRELDAVEPARRADFLRAFQAHPASRWATVKQLAAIARHDTFARLPAIGAETLVVTGDRDLLVAPDNSAILARRIPRARLVTLPEASHALLGERTDEVAGAVLDFLAGPAKELA